MLFPVARSGHSALQMPGENLKNQAILYPSYQQTRNALEAGEVTCQQLVRHYLQQIDRQRHLNAFLEVYAEEALQRAAELDQQFKQGTAGKLAGMVLGVKDVICHAAHAAGAASKILQGYVSPFSATAVDRLLHEGAIIIGRQNCDEFGMGSSNENSAYGLVKNPHDNSRVPGGSSGGSAVAVAAGMCLASLGTDTGGSVRQPAAFCGVVGVKPTWSRVSRHGLVAYASSFDTIGTLTLNVEDAALLLQIMAGEDAYDATVSRQPVPAYAEMLQAEGPGKVAFLRESLESEGVQPAIREKMNEVKETLQRLGHQVTLVDLPMLEFILPTYYILTTAEASTNLSRYDGVRYGKRSQQTGSLEELYKQTRSQGFGAEVIRRILLGTFVLSASYHDAYFTRAQKVRRLIKEKTCSLLQEYDFIMCPTTPTTAFKAGAFAEDDPVGLYLADLFTVQASVAGIPALSIPAGTDVNSLPVGVQVMAPAFQEAALFAFARQLSAGLQALKTK